MIVTEMSKNRRGSISRPAQPSTISASRSGASMVFSSIVETVGLENDLSASTCIQHCLLAIPRHELKVVPRARVEIKRALLPCACAKSVSDHVATAFLSRAVQTYQHSTCHGGQFGPNICPTFEALDRTGPTALPEDARRRAQAPPRTRLCQG